MPNTNDLEDNTTPDEESFGGSYDVVKTFNTGELTALNNLPARKTDNYLEPAQDSTEYFGKYIRKSRACYVCTRKDHMEINMMRARDHMHFEDIAIAKAIALDTLKKHFSDHFILSSNVQKVLNLKEDSSQESNELIRSILDGNVDLYAGSKGVLESKGQRLHIIQQRIKELSALQEQRPLEDIELQEFTSLCRLAEDIENSIVKTHQIIDKKLFPVSREDLSNAILSYKLGILQKILDDIQFVFIEYEKNPRYIELIKNLRLELSQRFNLLEDIILKSGGIIKKDGEL